MFDLTGKYALVTGGSRGIGKAIALALAKQGADVAVNCVVNVEKCDLVADDIKKLERESLSFQADVSKKQEVERMFSEVKEKWGKLDILVNNAGIVEYTDFESMTEEQWDRVLDVNLKGQFFCAQQAVALMKPQSYGRIINIASIASGGVGVGFARISHYTASKGGVVALTENMALDLAKHGINVNAVAPGAIETDMSIEALKDEKIKQRILERIPKGRAGKPEDVAAAVAFLASEEADYITGSVIYVDGGWLAG
jgi:NAD(P)-dependent dehydrogenase (short-subunit alcohol dehydrogenase family)